MSPTGRHGPDGAAVVVEAALHPRNAGQRRCRLVVAHHVLARSPLVTARVAVDQAGIDLFQRCVVQTRAAPARCSAC